MDTSPFFVDAVDEIPAAAIDTGEVVPAVPADADLLSFFPGGDVGADFVDDAGDFVARDARVLNPRHQAVFDEVIAGAHAASGDFDADLAFAGRRDIAFFDLEIGAGFGDYGYLHFRHGVRVLASDFVGTRLGCREGVDG